MKVIDLLNKIAKGEEVPKKIKYENEVYVSDHEGMDFYELEVGYGLLLEKINDTNLLNDEVEIIEEDTFEDIEEINAFATPISQELEGDLGCVVAIYNAAFYTHRDKIDKLIKNQKKIISKLDKE